MNSILTSYPLSPLPPLGLVPTRYVPHQHQIWKADNTGHQEPGNLKGSRPVCNNTILGWARENRVQFNHKWSAIVWVF